jgi:hypothetical protein
MKHLKSQARACAASAAVLSALWLGAGAQAQQAAAPAAAKAPAKGAEAGPQLPAMTVAQIVAKHVAARGGAEAWKGVHGLQLSGKMEAGRGSMDPVAAQTAHTGKHFPVREGAVSTDLPEGAPAKAQVQLPFVLDSERPNKTRLEIEFQGKKAVQVFDGTQGWKLRPFLNRNDIEPFTAEELKAETTRAEPEGDLVDYAAKGSSVALDGTEKVGGANTYRLKVTHKDGRVVHVWIDAVTFLDVRMDGTPKHMDGKMHDVHVAQRDFRKVDGVMIPFVLETSVDGYADAHRILIEKAVVNPSFDASTFAKPKV